MLRKTLVQSVILILAGLVLAVTANAFASRERKLVLPGFYPNAQRIPKRVPPTPVAPIAVAPTETIAQSPAPGQPPLAVPTDTIERPAGAAEPTPIVAPAGDPRQTAAAAPAAPPTAPAEAPPVAQQPAVDPLARFKPHPDQASVDISGEDAMLLHKRGVLFLDARRTSVYEEGHIAGARPFPVWESDIDERVNALYGERSDPEEQDKPIVIYCSGGACEDSHMLAQKLWGIQFNNVYVYKDGYPDWTRRGGAVKTGGQP